MTKKKSALTFEFHLFSFLAFHVQHLHLKLLQAEGTQISLCWQQQLHNHLEFHHSLSGPEEFLMTISAFIQELSTYVRFFFLEERQEEMQFSRNQWVTIAIWGNKSPFRYQHKFQSIRDKFIVDDERKKIFQENNTNSHIEVRSLRHNLEMWYGSKTDD